MSFCYSLFLRLSILALLAFVLSNCAPAQGSAQKISDQGNVELKLIIGDSYEMGSNRMAAEKPIHSVKISDFYIGTSEVTNAQFCAFLNAKGKHEEWISIQALSKHGLGPFSNFYIELINNEYQAKTGYENYPAVYVTWSGAKAFCAWAGGRLPTESEWEYAARGGKKQHVFAGTNEKEELRFYANVSGSKSGVDSFRVLAPIKHFKPNHFGLFDMTGNVSEWVADCYHSNYRGAPADGSAWNTNCHKTYGKVLRGGSWESVEINCQAVYRNASLPDKRFDSYGFRMAKDL